MGRAKVAMEPINNDKKRKTTFNTRKLGLIKKARELSTLCDVNVSMIISTDDQETPQLFPPDSNKLDRLIDLYKHDHCKDPRRNNHYALLDFFMDRKTKMEEELVKVKKKNVEAKYPSWFDFLDNLSEPQLREFALGLDGKIVGVRTRIESVKNLDYNSFGFDPIGVKNNLIMQLANPGLMNPVMRPVMMPPLNPNSLMNMMVNGDDGVFYDEGFSFQPPLMEHCFQPELWQQFLMSDFASQVKNTRVDGDGIFGFFE